MLVFNVFKILITGTQDKKDNLANEYEENIKKRRDYLSSGIYKNTVIL